MTKRLFQILDEMNVNDDVNKTATCGCCFDMVSADTVKAGGVVKMGVPAEAITRIFLGECQPFLILLDKKEYHRLKDLPVAMSEAEQWAERYEKALKVIANSPVPLDGNKMLAWTDMVKNLSRTALQQFKYGRVEDKVYRPCPHCGKELFRDRNLCCRACGKEVGDGQ